MKDALGHGSDAGHGTHSAMIAALPKKLGRKEFEQIAAQLRGMAAQGSPEEHNVRVNAMADHLATTNPGFRRDLFVKASQPDTTYRNKSTRASSTASAAKRLTRFKKVTG